MGEGGPEARQLFYERYRGKQHLMTQTVIDYQMLYDNIAIEISKGTGIDHNLLYGVTVLYKCPNRNVISLVNCDKACHSYKEVKEHIKKLKERFRNPEDRIKAIDKDYERC